MKNEKIVGHLLAIVTVLQLFALSAYGFPSGFKSVPAIKRPDLQGRPLPVDFLADSDDSNALWVVPKEGEFVSQGVVKSPATDCNALKDALRLDSKVDLMRNQVSDMMIEAQADYAAKQKDFRISGERKGKLESQIAALDKAIKAAGVVVTELTAEYKLTKTQRDALDKEIEIEEDRKVIQEKTAERAELNNKMADKRRQIGVIQKGLGEKNEELTSMEIELAGIKGRAQGLEDEISRLLVRIKQNMETITNFQSGANEVLKKYSHQVGAYTTFTAEFAPARFLQLLENANPGYSFRYVPSVTATVDATIPGDVRKGSALENELGTLILAAKWSDPRTPRLEKFEEMLETMKSFPKDLLGKKDITSLLPNIVQTSQGKLDETRRAEYESSLSGTKFLALKLSTLGYCALREPKSLDGERVGGAKDTFKLALYFTYPVTYAIDVKGTFHSHAFLHDFWKMTKSSSWFGLSKTQRVEHVRRMTQDDVMKIEVKPQGVALTLDESLLLTEKVKDQLTYFAAQSYLDTKGSEPPQVSSDPGELGASSVGKRLMLVPNPWAFWGGLILTSLGEMFGSSESTRETTMTTTKAEALDFRSGFTFMLAGDITVGDLTRVKEEVREIR